MQTRYLFDTRPKPILVIEGSPLHCVQPDGFARDNAPWGRDQLFVESFVQGLYLGLPHSVCTEITGPPRIFLDLAMENLQPLHQLMSKPILKPVIDVIQAPIAGISGYWDEGYAVEVRKYSLSYGCRIYRYSYMTSARATMTSSTFPLVRRLTATTSSTSPFPYVSITRPASRAAFCLSRSSGPTRSPPKQKNPSQRPL